MLHALCRTTHHNFSSNSSQFITPCLVTAPVAEISKSHLSVSFWGLGRPKDQKKKGKTKPRTWEAWIIEISVIAPCDCKQIASDCDCLVHYFKGPQSPRAKFLRDFSKRSAKNAAKFWRNFSQIFVLHFPGKMAAKNFTKNPRHFPRCTQLSFFTAATLGASGPNTSKAARREGFKGGGGNWVWPPPRGPPGNRCCVFFVGPV